MSTYRVKLNTIDKVKSFVDSVSTIEGNATLAHNGLSVNAKSILGIFSLDLSQTLSLKLDAEALPKELEVFLI